MYEINQKSWELAMMQAQEKNRMNYQTISKLIQIKNRGSDSINKSDLRYIDALFPFFDSEEKLAIKKFVAEKFDYIEVE